MKLLIGTILILFILYSIYLANIIYQSERHPCWWVRGLSLLDFLIVIMLIINIIIFILTLKGGSENEREA